MSPEPLDPTRAGLSQSSGSETAAEAEASGSPRLRVGLAPLTEAEPQLLADLIDDAVLRWTSMPALSSAESARAFLRSREAAAAAGKSLHFAVFVSNSNTNPTILAGSVGIHSYREGELELGYWLGTLWRGRGIASEALSQCIQWALEFYPHPISTLVLLIDSDNPASQAVASRAGFSLSGTQLWLDPRTGIHHQVERWARPVG